jgi:iron complex transport system substrate-binding protein
VLYLLGEEHRIVGISGFTVRPPRARKEKPRVSAFTSAKIERILALEPDLVLGFSDLQADIAAELVRRGIEVHVFNQRSVAEILRVIRMLGGLIGCEANARALCRRARGTDSPTCAARPRAAAAAARLLRGVGRAADLLHPLGLRARRHRRAATTCFRNSRRESLGKDRIVADPLEVPRRAPDIIFGSWCGKKFSARSSARAPGWQDVPAVRDRELHEVKSSIILQPGPAALTDGVRDDRVIAGAALLDLSCLSLRLSRARAWVPAMRRDPVRGTRPPHARDERRERLGKLAFS